MRSSSGLSHTLKSRLSRESAHNNSPEPSQVSESAHNSPEPSQVSESAHNSPEPSQVSEMACSAGCAERFKKMKQRLLRLEKMIGLIPDDDT